MDRQEELRALSLQGLYVIVDAELLAARGWHLPAFAEEMLAAGVHWLQYRNKTGSPEHVLRDASILRNVFAGAGATLILNDRPDLAFLSGCDGVHVGQDDLSPGDCRLILGPEKIIGLSTHTLQELAAAAESEADYLALGPIFSTSTKPGAAPTVGLETLRRARALTRKPLVAIGGITPANARAVREAGADAVAVISALFSPHETPAAIARDFIHRLR